MEVNSTCCAQRRCEYSDLSFEEQKLRIGVRSPEERACRRLTPGRRPFSVAAENPPGEFIHRGCHGNRPPSFRAVRNAEIAARRRAETRTDVFPVPRERREGGGRSAAHRPITCQHTALSGGCPVPMEPRY
ncbi:hypothetical protein SKAU_G00347720 [Synaphobranchus kaupii]|uniref:Uncharacterized protein n=1 Tax=Synaphobranchus kaupii TaxID=118154 RepID=A0A9Q1IHW6_SYNKA|nr:hypothetical protein SKAU_G00347720 [Synaphobranchus kaupii]